MSVKKRITSFTVTKVSEAREQIHIFSNSVSNTVNISLPFKLVIKNNAKVTMFWNLFCYLWIQHDTKRYHADAREKKRRREKQQQQHPYRLLAVARAASPSQNIHVCSKSAPTARLRLRVVETHYLFCLHTECLSSKCEIVRKSVSDFAWNIAWGTWEPR